MTVLKNVITVGVVGVVLIAGIARETSAAQQTATTGVVKIDDGTIQSRVAGSLKSNAILAPRDIDVKVSEGIVTLKGNVRSADEKARAGRLARGNGVTRVDNQIEIHPNIDRSKIDTAGDKTKSGLDKAVDGTVKAGKKTKQAVQKAVGKTEEGLGKAADKTSDAVGKGGDKMSDTSITTRVKAGFSDEKMLQDTAIEIETSDHVVTLKGTVASDVAKARAAAIASGIDGVTRVVNQIVVVIR